MSHSGRQQITDKEDPQNTKSMSNTHLYDVIQPISQLNTSVRTTTKLRIRTGGLCTPMMDTYNINVDA